MNNYIKVLNVINKLCSENKEPDISDISREINDLSPREVFNIITELDDRGFVIAVLIDMCCDEDYIVKGITEQGIDFLKNRNI